jgi:hypothetical protein
VDLPDDSTRTLTVIGLFHGKGTTFAEADAALAEIKAAREESGERVGRGSRPLGATENVAQGQQGRVGDTAAEKGIEKGNLF